MASSHPVRAALLAAVVLMSVAGCSSAHGDSSRTTSATATTLPPGTVTADHWAPPTLSGPPGASNFCAALTAIYRHMADLSHVVDTEVAEQYLSDYVTYSHIVIAEAPPGIEPSTQVYVWAVTAYLQKLIGARLDLGRLPAGALSDMASTPVNDAYRALSAYSSANCHYTIGGTVGG